MADETILPCPYCGEAGNLHGNESIGWVSCTSSSCAAAGPTKSYPQDAIAAWNSIAREAMAAAKPAAPVPPVPPEWVQFEGELGDIYWYRLAFVQAINTFEVHGEWWLTFNISDVRWKSKPFATRAAALAFVAGLGLPVDDADHG